MSIRTTEELTDALAAEIVWRRRELTDLRWALDQARTNKTRLAALTRAAHALLYAHWEGFVKNAAESYLEFICMQRKKNSELSDNMLAVILRTALRNAQNANKIRSHLEVVEFFRTKMETRSRLRFKNIIRTESNLSSKVLFEIVSTLGLSTAPYEPKAHLLDHQLLARRNHIAHGTSIDVDTDEYFLLHDEILNLMNDLRNRLENAAQQGQYLRHVQIRD